jgi:hypothetical protein
MRHDRAVPVTAGSDAGSDLVTPARKQSPRLRGVATAAPWPSSTRRQPGRLRFCLLLSRLFAHSTRRCGRGHPRNLRSLRPVRSRNAHGLNVYPGACARSEFTCEENLTSWQGFPEISPRAYIQTKGALLLAVLRFPALADRYPVTPQCAGLCSVCSATRHARRMERIQSLSRWYSPNDPPAWLRSPRGGAGSAKRDSGAVVSGAVFCGAPESHLPGKAVMLPGDWRAGPAEAAGPVRVRAGWPVVTR